MIVSSVFAATGVGLLSTLKPDSYHGMWIGYQGFYAFSLLEWWMLTPLTIALAGIGVGLGMQQPLIAVQTVLDISEVPIGTSIIIFIQT
jgi:hypothetical protein